MSIGAVVLRSGRVAIEDLGGIGRRMPLTMSAFAIAGLSLIGVPGTAGFISKWYLILGALDRGWWWFGGLLALGLGIAIWFGMGDLKRRTTFVPAIPLGLGVLGAFISTVWWYNWGHYGTNADGLVIEPGRTVAATTKGPWTVLWFILVISYVVGRQLVKTDRAGLVRVLVNFSWLLTPFVTYFVILRDPVDAGDAMVKELQDFVKAEIAPYKYPRAVEFVEDLPRTETGKLQRFRLRSK